MAYDQNYGGHQGYYDDAAQRSVPQNYGGQRPPQQQQHHEYYDGYGQDNYNQGGGYSQEYDQNYGDPYSDPGYSRGPPPPNNHDRPGPGRGDVFVGRGQPPHDGRRGGNPDPGSRGRGVHGPGPGRGPPQGPMPGRDRPPIYATSSDPSSKPTAHRLPVCVPVLIAM